MNVGIIGAGQIGATLVRQFSLAGHQVKMTNASGPEKLAKLAKETGAKAVTLRDAVMEVEVLIVSIPLIAVPKLSKDVGQYISSKSVIVDCSNYYPIRDGRIDEMENGMTESVWVSNHLQQPVVKVYNSILAGSLVQSGFSRSSAGRIALPISGDDQQTKSLVADLVNDSGFDALDIGNLQESWRQQPGSPVYCTDLNLLQLKKNITKVKRELLAERRDLALQFILKQNPEQWMDWWKACVMNNRNIFETDLNA